jgi:hypothetical protein
MLDKVCAMYLSMLNLLRDLSLVTCKMFCYVYLENASHTSEIHKNKNLDFLMLQLLDYSMK